jgi:phage host-nuclease inhibitor protein Gam
MEKTITDADTGTAMLELIGPNQVDFFNKFGLAGLPNEAKNEIINAKANILAEALSRFKLQNERQRIADLKDLQTALTSQSADISKISADVRRFQNATSQNITDVKTLINSSINNLSAEVSSVQNEVSAIQAHMWRGMNPHERLAALNDGFMRSLPVIEREELRKSLVDTVKVLNSRDKIITGLQTAGQIGNLLARAGVPIDVQNLQRNADIGTSAANLISNIALNNWIGALGSAGGLFGSSSGGPDPEVIAKLDEILALQKETLQKLNELSEQLEASTNKILESIQQVDAKIDTILSSLKEETYKIPLQTCMEFTKRANNYYRAKNGLYPSYIARASHFDDDNRPGGYGYYRKCREFIDRVKLINPNGVADGSDGITSNIFVESFVASNNAKPVGPLFSRMLAITMRSASKLPAAECWNRSLAYLSDAPPIFSKAKIKEFICTSDISQNRSLKSESGETINGKLALDRYLSLTAVSSITSYAMFLAPFNSLEIEKRGKSRLRSLDDLVRIGVNNAPDADAVVWPRHYIDILNLAVAQQTVLSGIYALPTTEQLLFDSNFGRKAGLARIPSDQIDEDGKCKATALKNFEVDKRYNPESHPAIACLLAENPYFLSNLSRHLVTMALLKSDSSLSDYNYALQSHDGTFIEAALPNIPIKWVKPADDQTSPWAIDLRDAAGRPWSVSLPTASEIRSETVAYRLGAYDLIELRNSLLKRVVLQSPDVSDLIQIESDGILLKRAFLDDPSLSNVDLFQ